MHTFNLLTRPTLNTYLLYIISEYTFKDNITNLF